MVQQMAASAYTSCSFSVTQKRVGCTFPILTCISCAGMETNSQVCTSANCYGADQGGIVELSFGFMCTPVHAAQHLSPRGALENCALDKTHVAKLHRSCNEEFQMLEGIQVKIRS